MNPRDNIEEELNIMFKKSCIIASLLSIIAGVPIALLLDGIAMKIGMGAVLIVGGFTFWMVIVYTLFNKVNDKRKYLVPLCVCALIATYSIVLVLCSTVFQNLPTAIRIFICISILLALLGIGYFGYKADSNEQKDNDVEVNETEGVKISPKPRYVYDKRTGLCVKPEKLCCDVLWTDTGPKYVEHIDED